MHRRWWHEMGLFLNDFIGKFIVIFGHQFGIFMQIFFYLRMHQFLAELLLVVVSLSVDSMLFHTGFSRKTFWKLDKIEVG
jgi:hypothetical protein